MNKKLKRTLGAILACSVILTTAAGTQMTAFADSTVSSGSAGSKSVKVKAKKAPLYMFEKGSKYSPDMPYYYLNGSDIPYFDLEEFADFYAEVLTNSTVQGLEVEIEVTKKGNKVILTRETGYSAIFDFDNNTVTFDDFDAFTLLKSGNLIDMVGTQWMTDEGGYNYIKTLKSATERYGHVKTMDLGSYGIDFIRDGDDYYVPFQTLTDIFLASKAVTMAFNGSVFILFDYDSDPLIMNNEYTPFGKMYYKNVKGTISKELTEFSYNELCFAFDTLYGLADQHNIESFNELVEQRGLKPYFLSTKTRNIDYAMCNIIYNDIDDLHSSFIAPSYATSIDDLRKIRKKVGFGRAAEAIEAQSAEYLSLRSAKLGDDPIGYKEVGDTAFITFDEFNTQPSRNYYESAPTADDKDTIGIIAYSVQRILRKGSPIKNVVLDLSLNLGGTVDAGAYTIAAFLGTASMSVENPYSGALVTSDYKIDTNFDGKFNSKDTLAGKGLHLYCITSGVSFSCGNLVPAVFKTDPHVTLIGKTSGGGACAVFGLSTATGTIMELSGFKRMSYLKNGSFYDVDRGVEPDFTVDKMENVYNRGALAEYIHNLF